MSKDKDIVNNDSMHCDMSEREVEKAGLSQENVRQILGHRITVAIGIEPGKADEDKNHLKHYDDLSFPLRLSSVTFDSLQSFENKLKAEFPWMESLITQIHKQCYLLLVMKRPEFHLRPILLVGPMVLVRHAFCDVWVKNFKSHWLDSILVDQRIIMNLKEHLEAGQVVMHLSLSKSWHDIVVQTQL